MKAIFKVLTIPFLIMALIGGIMVIIGDWVINQVIEKTV